MREKFFLGLMVSMVTSGPLEAVQQAQQRQQPQQAQRSDSESALDPSLMLTSSTLIGSEVVDPDGAAIAEVEQLLIDAETGEVEYVMLSMLADGDSHVAVPWSYLKRQSSRMILVASQDELARAPRMEVAPEPPGVPAESQKTAESTGNRISYAPSRPEGYARGEEISMAGTVVGTLTAPLQGETDHRVVYVDIGQGEKARLHLGPDWYIQELGVHLEPDDRISFSGYRVQDDELTIIVVNELHLDGRTFVLRNREGMGAWQRSESRN